MQDDKNRKVHIDFELTNNINSARRMMNNLSGDTMKLLHQVISLLEYKYLSENINNNDDIGYELNEELRYKNLPLNKGNIINTLKKGIKQITQDNNNIQAADVFYNLFNLVDFETYNNNDDWLLLIDIVERLCSKTTATIGETIIFISKYVSLEYGKRIKGTKPIDYVAELMTINQKNVKNIYDPFVDEATLLAEIGNRINVENYYGQHPNVENCTIAKMTLLANDVNYKNIFIKCNDILEPIEWNVKFDLCVSIPAFGRRMKFDYDDERFKPYVPKKSEFAYILDMFHNLDDDGTIKVIVPNGILFASQDKKIRKFLVDTELISSIIALPRELFNSTSIPTTLLTINKKAKDEGIYYLNIPNSKTKRKLEKIDSIVDINRYTDLLSNKKERKLISKIATIEDICENDYNLTINRYVDLEELKVIDIKKTVSNIKKIKIELKQLDEEIDIKLDSLLK